MPTNFDLAPPPVTVAGVTAVPVDFSTVRARVEFDAASSSARATAEVSFVVGPTAGCPTFDLRQTITAARLDGVQLPPARIRTLDLGGGPGADLRVVDQVLAAGTAHVLELSYVLGPPTSPAGGSYPPALVWSPGPRLRWTFGFTDLVPARYLEAWVPANLVWDQFALELELSLTGTTVLHRPITNGTVTTLGENDWRIAFPAGFTALSPMLEVRAVDTLTEAEGSVVLPVSGRAVTVEMVKLVSATSTDLAAALAQVSGWLQDNERDVGPYAHGDRFTAFLVQGGMEYEGGCTAAVGALRHETFHSWWGRGVKPAGQSDGWWDEGWNVYHDNGSTGVVPFDVHEPPVTLCNRNPFSRITPAAAYPAGERLFAGLAALTAPSALVGWMGEFYRAHRDRPVTTADLEAYLVAASGRPEVVDAFHRWVFGFADPPPAPAGPDLSVPDLWIRRSDDGGLVHQPPLPGQDNWFHARIRNRGDANRGDAVSRHFVVTFDVKPVDAEPLDGVRSGWPADYLPSLTAAAGFDLLPGGTQVVRARWEAAHVPPARTRARWHTAVLARGERPVLAHKNLTIAPEPPGHRC